MAYLNDRTVWELREENRELKEEREGIRSAGRELLSMALSGKQIWDEAAIESLKIFFGETDVINVGKIARMARMAINDEPEAE